MINAPIQIITFSQAGQLYLSQEDVNPMKESRFQAIRAFGKGNYGHYHLSWSLI